MDLTDIDHALKTLYPKGVHFEIYKESPLLAMMAKDTEFTGRNRVIDVIYAGNRRRSASFANAKAGTSNTQGKAFTITRKKNYAFGSIDRETMKAAKKDKGALVDALATESRMMISAFKQDLSADVYSDGSGRRGRLDSSTTLASTTIILDEPSDVRHFEEGDVIVLSAQSNGTSIKSGTLTVEAVNREAGRLTVDQNISTGVATAAASDYIYKQGDAAAKPTGIAGWVPATAPTSGDSFFGVDRSADPMRLAGIRYDGSSLNHEEALIKGLNFASVHQAFPKDIFMHPDDFAALEIILGSKKVYEDVEAAGIGFTSLVINGPKGKVRVFSDGWATKGVAYGLSLEHWTLHSLGDVPEWVTEDGNKLSRQSDADGFEFYLAAYLQYGCEAPGQQLRIALPSL